MKKKDVSTPPRKRVKDYLNGDYEIVMVRGESWDMEFKKSEKLNKRERARLKDILESEVKITMEASKLRLIVHVV